MRTDRIIGLLTAGALAALGGCGDVETTGLLSLTQVSGIAMETDGCGAPDKTLVPPLVYDAAVGAAVTRDYLLGLWLENKLVANDDTEGTSSGRINTNRIQVQRIAVEFLDRQRWSFLPERVNVGMPFVVDSEGSVGWPTRLLTAALAKQIVEHPASPIRAPESKAELPIRIWAEGVLLDGTAVESNPFDLTLTVCNGSCGGGCPVGYKVAKECSLAQPDLYECEEEKEETPTP
jgi:hypothetical protein